MSVFSAIPLGEAVRLRRRDWVPTFIGLLYRQALILVPPNHSMQRTVDSVLRLAAPSLGLRQRPLISTLGGIYSLIPIDNPKNLRALSILILAGQDGCYLGENLRCSGSSVF